MMIILCNISIFKTILRRPFDTHRIRVHDFNSYRFYTMIYLVFYGCCCRLLLLLLIAHPLSLTLYVQYRLGCVYKLLRIGRI